MTPKENLSLVRLTEEATQLGDLLASIELRVGRVGYVPRDPAIVPSGLFTTVGEEGTSLASYHGTNWSVIVEKLALEDILPLPPNSLSGGQAVRAAIAITAAVKPRAWLLDRCFEWLDSKSRAAVRAFFSQELKAGRIVTEVANRDNWLLGPEVGCNTIHSSHPQGEPPPSGERALIAEGLCVDFPGISIGPINLVVHRGERLALLGPNGSGKTSVARAILGLIEHRGRVHFPGHSGQRASAVIAFQNPDHQLFRPTVRREIEEAARRLDAFNPERADAMVRSLELGHFLDADPLALSFATRRLITIAAALIPNVPVTILDEPSAFLDKDQVASVVLAAQDAARRGTAVMAISHDDIFVDAFASRLMLLKGGQLVTLPLST
jgi:energy-coupling factor transporter ATP-binding protein EcfA2